MKRPSFQFYPSDWLRDTALRSCSTGARGLWMDMICFMHEGEPYGHLKVKDKVILTSNLSRMVGETLEVVEGWLLELFQAGVYDTTENSVIFSKRMVRDENLRQQRAAGGIKGGNPALMNKGKVNLMVISEDKQKPTPSSSSSSSVNTPLPPEGDSSVEFDSFWTAYPRKVAKQAAIKSWKRLKPSPELKDRILADLRIRSLSPDWLKDGGKFVPNPATYLNGRRWEDEGVTLPGAVGVLGAADRAALEAEKRRILSQPPGARTRSDEARLQEIGRALNGATTT